MYKFGRIAAVGAVGLAALFGTTAAHASLIVTASVGGAPSGQTYVNFDNMALGNAGGTSGSVGVSFTGDGGVVSGNLSGRYAAPYLSGNNGVLFGDPTNGLDTTNYLTTGIGSVTITLPTLEHYMGLLWGSVDSYNTLELYDGSTLVGSVTGSDITNPANGNQGINGTYYVNISSTLAFDTIVASSTQYGFEFDNLSYDDPPAQDVPESPTLPIVGAALTGLLLLAARQRRAAKSRKV